MSTINWLGFIGVFLILLAYVLNVFNKISNKNIIFILLNLLGASAACLASILQKFIPFVFLEGVWAFISLVSLVKYFNKKSNLWLKKDKQKTQKIRQNILS